MPSANATASSGDAQAHGRELVAAAPHAARRRAMRQLARCRMGMREQQRALTMIAPRGISPVAGCVSPPSSKSSMRGAGDELRALCSAATRSSSVRESSDVPATSSETGRVDANGSNARARASS